jgi:hypothetical protein
MTYFSENLIILRTAFLAGFLLPLIALAQPKDAK